jgi:Dynein heavy chain AAA lid domain
MGMYFALKAVLKDLEEPTPEVLENQFAFCCLWSFGSAMDAESQEMFSDWWKSRFPLYSNYPHEKSVRILLFCSEIFFHIVKFT